jgi:hypothetical protein
MSFNEITIQLYYQAVRLMFSDKAIKDGMRALDQTARSLVPHPVWDQLKQIDFEREQPGLQAWVEKQVAQHADGIAVLLFRLADLGDRMDLQLLRQTRPPADDSDWQAYDASLAFEIPSQVLEKMAEIAEAELTDDKGEYTNEDAGWIVETCYPLAYAGLAVGKLVQSLPPKTLLGSDARRRVAVFFAEGDDFILGEVTPQGFQYSPIPAFIA